VPKSLGKYRLEVQGEGKVLHYAFDSKQGTSAIAGLLNDLAKAKISYNDLHTDQSSLEDIFLKLVQS
jgi:ABC-2 type transport system ATP-binding protein